MNRLSKTEALYQKDDTQLTADVSVELSIPFADLPEDLKPLFRAASEDDFIVATDKTVFYAQGGGQPADIGVMSVEGGESAFRVTGVRRAPSGTILHIGKCEGKPFSEGDLVHQQVNGDTRKLHSRIHDGGHIMSSAVRRLADSVGQVAELKAQHYPDSSFVEFKGLIDGKHKQAIEDMANSIIEEDRAINVCWWAKEDLVHKCWSVPDGIDIPEGELARAVDIDGVGAYYCGGTHMKTTRQVGQITVRKISRQKGISKISYALK